MRNESKTKTRIREVANTIQSYHSRTSQDVNYAFQGYEENFYFVNDRAKKLNEHFQLPDGTALKGYGLEIELESDYISDSNALARVLHFDAFQKLPEKLFKFQRDGSLGTVRSAGAEAITQVMTKEFIRNHYDGFAFAYAVFKQYAISAARSGHCGMHCNMSVGLFGASPKTREEAIKKFIYFVNKHYAFFCAALKRPQTATGYCRQMRDWDDKEYAKSYDLSVTSEYDSNHGICFNFAHYNTGRVELRLVGGQPNYAAFRNTMEVIFHCVAAVKALSWEALDDLKVVFKGCNKYVLDRLHDCAEGYSPTLSASDYEAIASTADMEVDFGNF